jgi:hypothetical protein
MTLVTHSSWFPVSADELYRFHADPRNLAKISPPFPRLSLVGAAGVAQEGDVQDIRLSIGPLCVYWKARITVVREGRLIEDVQESGPFSRWRHQHRVAAERDGSCLTDAIAFRLLPTAAGEFVEYLLVRPALIAMLAYRHRATRRLLVAGG